jgi:hypothetical protein
VVCAAFSLYLASKWRDGRPETPVTRCNRAGIGSLNQTEPTGSAGRGLPLSLAPTHLGKDGVRRMRCSKPRPLVCQATTGPDPPSRSRYLGGAITPNGQRLSLAHQSSRRSCPSTVSLISSCSPCLPLTARTPHSHFPPGIISSTPATLAVLDPPKSHRLTNTGCPHRELLQQRTSKIHGYTIRSTRPPSALTT